MLILSDLDGVGAEMDLNLRRRWAVEHPDLPLPQDFLTWNWHKDISKAHTKAFNRLLESDGFFSELEPVPGWAEAMNKLLDEGHDVLIASTPWASSRSCWQDKVDWVGDTLGGRWRDRVQLIRDKTLLDADVLIDDKPEITGRNTGPRRTHPAWTQIIFDQPYNRDIEGPRIMNWTDGSWEEVLHGLPVAQQIA